MMILTLFINALTLFALEAGAVDEFSGRLEFVQRVPHLRMEGLTTPLKIQFANRGVAKDVLTLTDGDGIQGEGKVDETQTTIALHNVTAIGVQKLLGTWKSIENGTGFNFWSFDTLYKKPPNTPLTRKWTYQLAPESVNKWSVQMESEGLLEFGTIEYQVDRFGAVSLIFCLLDTATGYTKSKHTLVRNTAKGNGLNDAQPNFNSGDL